MKQRKPQQAKTAKILVPQKSTVERFAEILKILSAGPAGDHASVSCFLFNRSARLGYHSPIQVFCEGDPKMLAEVRQLAIESLE